MKEHVALMQKEKTRLKVLNSLLAGHMPTEQAETLMSVSERRTRRMLVAYREEGAAALGHGNRNRQECLTPVIHHNSRNSGLE